MTAAALLAGCGGGGGGSEGESPAPAPAYELARILVSEQTSSCGGDYVCMWGSRVFLDETGEATVFWREVGAQSGWQVAVNDPGSLNVRSRMLASSEVASELQPLALSGKRFAAVHRDAGKWTSALVDMSKPTAPSVSERVTMPLDHTAEMITGLDGAFAMGPNVVDDEISLGGDAIARGVNRPLPDGYSNLWWGTVEDAVGVTPTALWAFNALKAGSTVQGVHLTRVDLQTGDVGEVTEVPGWYRPGSYVDQCLPFGRKLAVKPYGRGQIAVGWVNNRADAPRGCDVLVDGVVMNTPGWSGSGLPALGGSDAGPVAVWQEYGSDGRLRVLWRQRNTSTGTWSSAAPISDQFAVRLIGSATSPSGILAIAWSGCSSSMHDSCASYVSKYDGGVWTTSQFTAPGSDAFSVSMAINWRGQAIIVWVDEYGMKCSNNTSNVCPRTFAYRF